MQSDDRTEFESILAELFGAIDKPLTEAKRQAFWKGLEKMSLPQFARARDLLLGEMSDGEARKSFAVTDVWNAHRRTRRPETFSAPTAPASSSWAGDGWDKLANHHLLAYLMRHMRRAHRYHPDSRYDEAQHCAVPGPEGTARTKILVAAKNAWAVDMREAQADGTVPADGGKEWFAGVMAEAERLIQARERQAA